MFYMAVVLFARLLYIYTSARVRAGDGVWNSGKTVVLPADTTYRCLEIHKEGNLVRRGDIKVTLTLVSS